MRGLISNRYRLINLRMDFFQHFIQHFDSLFLSILFWIFKSDKHKLSLSDQADLLSRWLTRTAKSIAGLINNCQIVWENWFLKAIELYIFWIIAHFWLDSGQNWNLRLDIQTKVCIYIFDMLMFQCQESDEYFRKSFSFKNIKEQTFCDNFVFLEYRKVASSRLVYYSILNSFAQRSQYISIKFPLHKQSENPWVVCY